MPADGWYNYIDFLGRAVVFPAPTDATNEMLRAIREEVDALYIEGTRYRKTGIVFFGLEKPGTAHQTNLFDDTPPAEKSRLYAHARGAVVGRPNGKNPTRGNVAGLCGEADDA